MLEGSFNGKSKEQWGQAEWKNEGFPGLSVNGLLKLKGMVAGWIMFLSIE